MNEIKTTSTLEQLTRAIKYLRAYQITNEGFLEPNDEFELSSCINELVLMKKDAEDIQKSVPIDDDPFDGQLYLVHAADMCDLLNTSLYDVYGRLYVKHNGSVECSQFGAEVKKFYQLSRSAIELAFDIISDMYATNEANGCHRPDGCYDHGK